MPDRHGLYRNDHWVFLTDGVGARTAMTPHDYIMRQYEPPLAELIDELQYHEKTLAGEIKG